MDAHIAASWITSGWIDVAMIAGWMAFVVLVGRRVWKHGQAAGAAERGGISPAAADARAKRKRRAR